jgi:hypothetical protein
VLINQLYSCCLFTDIWYCMIDKLNLLFFIKSIQDINVALEWYLLLSIDTAFAQ